MQPTPCFNQPITRPESEDHDFVSVHFRQPRPAHFSTPCCDCAIQLGANRLPTPAVEVGDTTSRRSTRNNHVGEWVGGTKRSQARQSAARTAPGCTAGGCGPLSAPRRSALSAEKIAGSEPTIARLETQEKLFRHVPHPQPMAVAQGTWTRIIIFSFFPYRHPT
ncbi:predicted protein [Uncinocarpus reesii 1704]|uniref:Uncharacterized protein n=1 Tax=Uncinocarpus reesii (strain UAMH 1704) TaxID=336963 RepID=C4JZC2_UNCRE|nr:uncharacterized protein UREG_07523 [Uncinocarpus reesii 1704]EEP82658.1 predicted protein [Uncinocarpus reesii 1704]